MSVISIKELHQRRRSSYRDGKASHTRVFLVTTNDIKDGTAVAMTAAVYDEQGNIKAAVPSPGQTHNQDGSAIVTGIDAQPVQDSGVHFEVSCEYSGGGAIGVPTSPLDRAPEISYGSSDVTAGWFMDHSDPPKPCVNSAGDPFDNVSDKEANEIVITITVNEPSHSPIDADAFSNSVNKDAVTIDGITYAAGTLKLSPITAQKTTERVEENGAAMDFVFYRRTYVLKAKKDGWKEKVLDTGLNELIANADLTKPGRVIPIVDGVNAPVKRPWPLDGAGRKKPKSTDTPAELTFRKYPEVEFAPLVITRSELWAA